MGFLSWDFSLLEFTSNWHCFSNAYCMKQSKNKPSLQGDLQDKPKDRPYLASEETTLDLPDVEDIPGQENIHPPKMSEFADTTISSADEEGEGIVGLDDEEDDIDDESDVSEDERELLDASEEGTGDEDDAGIARGKLDDKDEDGEPLNEEDGLSGSDLDVPGSEDDDDNEELGEEDEENNSYSLGGDRD